MHIWQRILLRQSTLKDQVDCRFFEEISWAGINFRVVRSTFMATRKTIVTTKITLQAAIDCHRNFFSEVHKVVEQSRSYQWSFDVAFCRTLLPSSRIMWLSGQWVYHKIPSKVKLKLSGIFWCYQWSFDVSLVWLSYDIVGSCDFLDNECFIRFWVLSTISGN